MGTTETEVNVVDKTISDKMVVYLERHINLELLLASDSEIDWHVDHLDRQHGAFLLPLLGVIHAKENTSFPGPVGAVLDPDFLEDSLTGRNIVYLLYGLGPANCTLLLPLATAATTPLMWALTLIEPLRELVVRDLEAVFFKLLLDILLLHALGTHKGFEHVLPLAAIALAAIALAPVLFEKEAITFGCFSLLLILLLFIV